MLFISVLLTSRILVPHFYILYNIISRTTIIYKSWILRVNDF
jgi:hypothetical protein